MTISSGIELTWLIPMNATRQIKPIPVKLPNRILTKSTQLLDVPSRRTLTRSINARSKKTGKMQWIREWAHRVLQTKAMIASQQWNKKWQDAFLSALEDVA